MGRKIQVGALSLVGAFAFTTAAFAQPAEAPSTAKPAEATAGTTEPAAASAPGDVAPAAPAAAAAPAATPAPATPEPAPAPAAASPIAPDTASPATFESLKVESKNGSATLKIGLLLQPQYEALGSPDAAHTGTSNNLFLRRTRLLVGGTLFKNFEYFFDTDAPNLFRGNTTATGGMAAAPASGEKTGPGIGVQDAMATWKAYDDMLKFDAGYMLTPGAHNALQGAGTLLGLDYFSNSFTHSNVFNGGVPVGRDAGVEVRGLLLDNHIEYRAGLFQGLRKPGTNPPMGSATGGEVSGQNMFRFAGRIQINLLDAETGFFYAGTYLGKKKIVSVGGALDMQSGYHHWAVDGFADLPAGPGTLTAQVNFSKWNGGTFVNLPKQTALMAEAGYRFDGFPIAPIAKFELQDFGNSDAANTRVGGGLAYFPYGHNINVKAFFTNINAKPAAGDSHSYNQFQLQWQLYFY